MNHETTKELDKQIPAKTKPNHPTHLSVVFRRWVCKTTIVLIFSLAPLCAAAVYYVSNHRVEAAETVLAVLIVSCH